MRNFDFHSSAAVNKLFDQAGLVIKDARELCEGGQLNKSYAFDIIAAAIKLREAINCAGVHAIQLDNIDNINANLNGSN